MVYGITVTLEEWIEMALYWNVRRIDAETKLAATLAEMDKKQALYLATLAE